MAYETGSATDVNDLIGKIRAFLEANGYAINHFTTVGTGYRLNVQKGSWYVNMRSVANERALYYSVGNYEHYGIAVNGSTGYNSEASGGTFAWSNQPGKPYSSYASYGLGSFAGGMTGAIPGYHLFLDTDGFAACIEISTGIYRWLYWGMLTLFGNAGGDVLDGFFTGATCGYAENAAESFNPFCRYGTMDGATFFLYFVSEYEQNWFGATVYSVTTFATGLQAYAPLSLGITTTQEANVGYLHNLMRSIPGGIGNLSPLLPCYMGVKTPTSDTLLGHFDMVRMTRIAAFTTGQEVTIGGHTWKVLPAISRTHDDGYAIAVRKAA